VSAVVPCVAFALKMSSVGANFNERISLPDIVTVNFFPTGVIHTPQTANGSSFGLRSF
jgi:hypothetical protein